MPGSALRESTGPRFARNEGAEDREKNGGRGTDPEQPREGFMSISKQDITGLKNLHGLKLSIFS